MHRYQGTTTGNASGFGTESCLSRIALRPSSPITFWKSQYAKDRHSIFNTTPSITGYMRSQITAASPTTQYKRPVSRGKSAGKSILKRRDKDGESEPENVSFNEENSPRGSYMKLNLITTGTGSGKPHGAKDRIQSGEKHVKFDRLPKPFTSAETRALVSGSGSLRGNRNIHAKRSAPAVRRLGSGLMNQRVPAKNTTVVTLSGGESHIKSQIESFVKKLRLTESARLAKMVEDKDSREEHPDKFRKPRPNSTTRFFHDWAEFDLDNIPDETGSNQEIDTDHLMDKRRNGSDVLSDRASLSSTTLDFADERAATRTLKPKPMASLNTKYRHITTNDVNLHKYDDLYQQVVLGRKQVVYTGKNTSLYHCDPQKASDIMGWLSDVEKAKSNAGQT